jgi:hypothetical protein
MWITLLIVNGGLDMVPVSGARFGLGSTVWVIIVAVLLVVLAAMVIYVK